MSIMNMEVEGDLYDPCPEVECLDILGLCKCVLNYRCWQFLLIEKCSP